MHNPDFKVTEFSYFKNQSGSNGFALSVQQWVSKTNAIGIFATRGRYNGGTYAHKDIAFEFASWISAEFKLYLKARQQKAARKFVVIICESYHRRRAISGEKSLPVLEAAHIRPYADQGPHLIQNGLLLRSDLHILFDQGYITVTPDAYILISKRIRQEFENGKDYYALDGQTMKLLPESPQDRPSADFLGWHNQNRYLE